jgi:hypothetical protein
MFYDILVHAHSGIRWIVLILILAVIINAGSAMSSKRLSTPKDARLSMIAMTSVHLQVLIGLILYFISPRVQFSGNTMSNDQLRFFTVEHTLGMLIAVILITIGHRKAKGGAFKSVFWYYLIALLIILVSIPWPFRGFGNGWF